MRSAAAVLLVGLLVAGALPAQAEHVHESEISQACDFGHSPPRLDCGGGIPSIQSPGFEPGDWLADDDVVIGLEIGGDARAYPIRVLDWHEIVNDEVGGRKVAVTYCPLCRTGIVFDRALEDRVLTFHVSGFLYKNDLVMRDAQTQTLWSQVLGEAIRGELHRSTLEIVPAWTLPWGEWRAEHPGTKVLARPRCGDGSTLAECAGSGFQRNYDVYPYGDYQENRRTGVSGKQAQDEEGLHPKALVLGLRAGDGSKAYPFEEVHSVLAANDRVGDVNVLVTYARGGVQAFHRGEREFTLVEVRVVEDADGNRFDALTGKSLHGGENLPLFRDAVPSFWFAWRDFHPSTEVYAAPVEAQEAAAPHVGNEPPRQESPEAGGSRAVPVPAVLVMVAVGLAALVAWRLRGGR